MHDTYNEVEVALSVQTTGEQPPTVAQLAFYERIVGDLDSIFAKVADHLVPQYEAYLRSRQFPEKWSDALALVGVGIPLDGNEDHPWDVTFRLKTDNLGYLFTCYFERGCVVGVGVDT
jgi:hypothetical protein